jgi:hypothetical protein
LDDEVVPVAENATNPKLQTPPVGKDQLRVPRRRSAPEQEATRTGDHLSGLNVIAALVPRADQATVHVDAAF